MLHAWVETAGGPLIAIPKSELYRWVGADDNGGPVETWGDYGRVYAVEGYICLVTVGAQQALILGDEPAMTTYLPDRTPLLALVRRILRAELVVAAERALAGQPDWDDDEDLNWEADLIQGALKWMTYSSKVQQQDRTPFHADTHHHTPQQAAEFPTWSLAPVCKQEVRSSKSPRLRSHRNLGQMPGH